MHLVTYVKNMHGVAPITITPAHEYQAQTIAGVSKVVLPVKNEHKRIN
jgi:hypothetical protein